MTRFLRGVEAGDMDVCGSAPMQTRATGGLGKRRCLEFVALPVDLRFFLILKLRWILRCHVGNDSALKVDEPALGKWVRVVCKSRNNRKDLF